MGAGDRSRRGDGAWDLPELQDPAGRGELQPLLGPASGREYRGRPRRDADLQQLWGPRVRQRGERHGLRPPGNRDHRLGRRRRLCGRIPGGFAIRGRGRGDHAQPGPVEQLRQRDGLVGVRQRLQRVHHGAVLADVRLELGFDRMRHKSRSLRRRRGCQPQHRRVGLRHDQSGRAVGLVHGRRHESLGAADRRRLRARGRQLLRLSRGRSLRSPDRLAGQPA